MWQNTLTYIHIYARASYTRTSPQTHTPCVCLTYTSIWTLYVMDCGSIGSNNSDTLTMMAFFKCFEEKNLADGSRRMVSGMTKIAYIPMITLQMKAMTKSQMKPIAFNQKPVPADESMVGPNMMSSTSRIRKLRRSCNIQADYSRVHPKHPVYQGVNNWPPPPPGPYPGLAKGWALIGRGDQGGWTLAPPPSWVWACPPPPQ